MTRRDLGSLIFRSAGLYLLLQAFMGLNQFVGYLFYGVFSFSLSGSLGNARLGLSLLPLGLPTLMLLVGSWFLIRNSDALAERFFGGEGDATMQFAITRQEVFAIALALMGVYLCAVALKDSAQELSTIAMYSVVSGNMLNRSGPSSLPSAVTGQIIPRLLGDLLQFVIGFWLAVGKQGLASLWHWGRTATTYPPLPEAAEDAPLPPHAEKRE